MTDLRFVRRSPAVVLALCAALHVGGYGMATVFMRKLFYLE